MKAIESNIPLCTTLPHTPIPAPPLQFRPGPRKFAQGGYVCNEPGCPWPSPFPTKQGLNRHHEVKHLEQRLNCPIPGCESVGNRGIKRKDNLRAHVWNQHRVELPRESRRTYTWGSIPGISPALGIVHTSFLRITHFLNGCDTIKLVVWFGPEQHFWNLDSILFQISPLPDFLCLPKVFPISPFLFSSFPRHRYSVGTAQRIYYSTGWRIFFYFLTRPKAHPLILGL